MNYDKSIRPSLAKYIAGRLAVGQLVFSRDESKSALGINTGAFFDAAEKLQKQGKLLNLRQGFYVIVPPQHRNFGSPPPVSFIDDLMHHRNRPYYVGLLKAAELHGAAHQAIMEFQVITDRQIRDIPAGRSRIVFYYKKELSLIASAIEDRKTETGKMKLSSVELTFLDLLRYPQASGGLDNVLTILADLGHLIDPDEIASLGDAFEGSIIQRAGYLLDHAGFGEKAEKLYAVLERGARAQWVELDPSIAADPDLAPAVLARDERWRVVVRRFPERDE
jgi:predicted transcriptional regulator of viral defense system